jgi:hypothetical protein
MDPFTGLHVTASGLLGLGGLLKVARPSPASAALRSLGLPAPPAVVRAVGVGEVAVAIVALTWGGAVAFGLQALCYIGFVVVALALWRHGGVASCGCFGEIESPPGPVHVVVTAAGVAVSARAALEAAPAPIDHLPSLALGVVALGVVYLVLVDLPRLGAARRLHRGAIR